MPTEVRIEGLEELRRNLSPKHADYVARIVVRRAGLRIRRQAREIVPGKIFDQSIQVRTDAGGLGANVISTASPAKVASIHGGRAAGEVVPLRVLKAYVRRYGLAGVMSVKSHRQVGKKSVSRGAIGEAAAALQQQIKQRGTKAIAFFSGAVGPSRADIDRYVKEAGEALVRKLAKGR